jgi:protein tyrosine/serine phosphatase
MKNCTKALQLISILLLFAVGVEAGTRADEIRIRYPGVNVCVASIGSKGTLKVTYDCEGHFSEVCEYNFIKPTSQAIQEAFENCDAYLSQDQINLREYLKRN